MARRGENIAPAETRLRQAQLQRDALAQEAGAASVDLEQFKHETLKVVLLSCLVQLIDLYLLLSVRLT